MSTITSVFPDVLSDDLTASRDFYTGLLGLKVAWESDWYVLLQGDQPGLQLAFVAREHDSVPRGHRARPAGVLITVEVDDAAALWQRATDLGLPVAQELRDEPFGQRHFMAVDPNGLVVDVVQTLFVPEEETA